MSTNEYQSLLTSLQSPQPLSPALRRVRETTMTSRVSPTSPTTPSSPHLTISREEIANTVANRVAARAPQRRIVLPDTEEWVEARREPLRILVVSISTKFDGPKVRCAACRLYLRWRTDTCWQAERVLEVLRPYVS
jgi:hypothetical protein